MTAGKHPLRRRLPALVGGLFLILFTAGVVWMVYGLVENQDKPQRPRVQQISLVKPPPPRELPKPPEPEKLEEQQQREEVKLEETQPTPEQAQSDGPPPGDQLGLDAEGGGDGDAFGLAARKGGRDITTLGTAGSGGGDRQAWYARQIARHFEEGLRRAKGLNGSTYNLQLYVWFDEAGRVRQVRMARGSGDGEVDRLIQEELHGLPPLRETLPEDLPQPVRVRVVSRT